MRLRFAIAVFFVFACAFPVFAQQSSLVIINARLADGTGAPLRKANLRITGLRISRIGNFRPSKTDKVLDAKGLVLAPGFIDIHNHSTEGLDSDPLAERNALTRKLIAVPELKIIPVRLNESNGVAASE